MLAELKYLGKAAWAFLALFVTNLAADWLANGQPWPADWRELVRWVLSIGAGTWLVYRQTNGPKPVKE